MKTNVGVTTGWSCGQDTTLLLFYSEIRVTTNRDRVSNNNMLTQNAWNFVALTVASSLLASDIHLYVATPTGALAEVTYASGNNGVGAYQDDAADSFLIGNNPGGTEAYPGTIAEVGLWNVVLSTDQMAAIRRNSMPYFSPRGRWPLWGIATPEIDLSGNLNSGTVTGASAANGPPTGKPFPYFHQYALPGSGLIIPGSTCVQATKDIMGVSLPSFDTGMEDSKFVEYLNEAMAKLEQTLNDRIMVDAPCEVCPTAAGVVTLDMARCSNFIIDTATPINKINIVNATPGQRLDVQICNRGNATVGVGGWPTSVSTQDIPTSLSPGYCTAPSFVAGPSGASGGGMGYTQRSKPAAAPGGSGGALALTCAGGNCSINCGATSPSLMLQVTGGVPPYTWETTAGTITTSGVNDADGELTPPTNTGSGVAGVAYERIWCESGGGQRTTDHNCADVIGACVGTANCSTCISHTCGGVVTTMNGLGGCDTTIPTNAIPCGGQITTNTLCDTRSASMITDGCNPCGISMDDVVVTVTDDFGTSVSKTITTANSA